MPSGRSTAAVYADHGPVPTRCSSCAPSPSVMARATWEVPVRQPAAFGAAPSTCAVTVGCTRTIESVYVAEVVWSWATALTATVVVAAPGASRIVRPSVSSMSTPPTWTRPLGTAGSKSAVTLSTCAGTRTV